MRPGRFLLACAAVLWAAEFVPAHADTIRVAIDNLEFMPASISAKVGDTIEWVNNDVFAHTATVRGDWDVMIAPKKTARFTLKASGDVEYYCRYHPNMKGRIAVAPK